MILKVLPLLRLHSESQHSRAHQPTGQPFQNPAVLGTANTSGVATSRGIPRRSSGSISSVGGSVSSVASYGMPGPATPARSRGLRSSGSSRLIAGSDSFAGSVCAPHSAFSSVTGSRGATGSGVVDTFAEVSAAGRFADASVGAHTASHSGSGSRATSVVGPGTAGPIGGSDSSRASSAASHPRPHRDGSTLSSVRIPPTGNSSCLSWFIVYCALS